MKSTRITVSTISSEDEQYTQYMVGLQLQFNVISDQPMFVTDVDVDKLWNKYIANLPTNNQHYNCNTCRHFIQKYGKLVIITTDGKQRSAIFGGTAPDFFAESNAAMKKLVENAAVISTFQSSDVSWGVPITGEWRHLHVTPKRNRIFSARLINAEQKMAEQREEFKMLNNALAEYSEQTVDTALSILRADTLYRGDKVKGVAEWFDDIQGKVKSSKSSTMKNNLKWVAIANAPAGFAHVKSSMIGTLLDDIQAGLPMSEIKQNFSAKMNPTQYQRAQVAPSTGLINRGEKIIAEMKAEGSLARRHATLAELQYIWKPQQPKERASGGVFAKVTAKKSNAVVSPIVSDVQGKLITWEKFSEKIMPTAKNIEVFVPANTNRMAGLVAPVNPNSTPLIQWDNQFSWYYENGIDAEMKQRVVSAGGMVENVDIRATLMWNNRNDLDLHVTTPKGEEIFYGNKRGESTGGWLDVDMNVGHDTLKPVENIRWQKGKARAGWYTVSVWNYSFYQPEYGRTTPYFVSVEVNGVTRQFQGEMHRYDTGSSSRQTVYQFYYDGSRVTDVRMEGRGVSQPVASHIWNVQQNKYAKCIGIVNSPNMWGERPAPQHGEHVIFLLEGCTDTDNSTGHNFFAETLKSEYREIRAVLDAWNNQTTLEGMSEAAGIGMVKGSDWNLMVKVVDQAGMEMNYKIDRWD